MTVRSRTPTALRTALGAITAIGTALAIVAVALVGVSRVYLGVHWATDVVGGWILGACWTAGLTTAFRPLGPDGRTGSSDSFDPGGATRRSA